MSASLRPIQSAMNASGFPVNHQNMLNDVRPTILQNFLQGTYSVTSSTTLSQIGVGTQASIAAGSDLSIELQQGDQIAEQGTWIIEGRLFLTGVLVGIGAKVNLIAQDGLQILTAAGSYSQMEIDLNNTGAAPVSAYGFASATATNTASVTAVVASVYISGIVQLTNYGRLTAQIAQNVSTGTAIVVGAGSYLRAEAICQL